MKSIRWSSLSNTICAGFAITLLGLVACVAAPTSTHRPPKEEAIKLAIQRVYESSNDERWLDMWNSYTSEWRDNCSFEEMVEHLQGQRKSEVSEFYAIEISGATAHVSYRVTWLDAAGRLEGEYDRTVHLVKQGNDWLWEEGCY